MMKSFKLYFSYLIYGLQIKWLFNLSVQAEALRRGSDEYNIGLQLESCKTDLIHRTCVTRCTRRLHEHM